MPDSPMPGPESESSGASSTEAEAETPKPEPTYENPNRPFMECPILVWMLSLNREYTVEEYNACHNVVTQCVHHIKIPYNPREPDSFRHLITLMLPLLMMRHRRVPRSRWKDFATATGKRWIEQAQDDMTPERFMQSMIGYHLTIDGSLCGMAMSQGVRHKVINIGMGTRRTAVEPRGVTVAAYVESLAHKLTPLEMSTITQEPNDETMLRRLSMLLAIKQAYIKAIGQPIGFDHSRLEFNMPEKTCSADGHPLTGWEFRIWRVNLGVARKDVLVSENYECAVAFFRGSPESTFIFFEHPRQLASWVQFINIDQMMKVVPKLTA